MDNGPQEKSISQMRYNYRWRITFPAQDNTNHPKKEICYTSLHSQTVLAIHSVKHLGRGQQIAGSHKWKGSPVSTE
eukprot:8046041-Ditylum_brightwellii.AAC.2